MPERKPPSSLRREDLTFLARFGVLFFTPYLALQALDVTPLASWIAGAEASLFNALSIPSTSGGPLLYVAGSEVTYRIVADCTGLVMVILLFALLYATRLDHRRRLLALLAVAPLLLAFNLVRLAATLLVGFWFGALALEAAHILLWFVDSGVVLLAWSRAARVKLL